MRLMFHAPNVHTGGGLRLMQDVLAAAPASMDWAQIDARARNAVAPPPGITTHYVRHSLMGRLAAEWRLYREAKATDTVLSFNGLPPLFPNRAETVVFLQNRLLIESGGLREHGLKVRVRLMLERLWLSKIRWNRIRYVVQTPSMAQLLKRRMGANATVSVMPFAAGLVGSASPPPAHSTPKRFDFVYVSSGDAHKNHLTLLEAWSLLAEKGKRPSLALTVDPARHPQLCAAIGAAKTAHGLAIENLGMIPREEVSLIYAASGALIFPSTTESFGLPLVEAAEAGLPILAPELDYVRDLATPAQTFDANSARSIARAVLRHQGHPEPTVDVLTAAEFLAGLGS